MKNNTIQVFAALGVILLILVVIGMYFFAADSYGLKDGSVMTESTIAPTSTTQSAADMSTSTEIEGEVTGSGGFELSSAQVEALVSLGIDPADVPSSISAEQERCFVEALGEDRVVDIKAGAVPNALEFMKARSCI